MKAYGRNLGRRMVVTRSNENESRTAVESQSNRSCNHHGTLLL